MIFELMENANDEDTVIVLIDNYTFNQIMKMLVCEAYHKGQAEHADMDADDSKKE